MSDGLDNGKKHNYSNYTIDHYDEKKLSEKNKTAALVDNKANST